MPRLGSLLGDSEKPPFDPLWYGNVHRRGLLVLRCFHKCNIFLASYLPVGRLDGAAVCPLSDKAMKETVERGRVRRLAGPLSPTPVSCSQLSTVSRDREAPRRIWLTSEVMGHNENALKRDQERVLSADGSSLKFSTPQRSPLSDGNNQAIPTCFLELAL